MNKALIREVLRLDPTPEDPQHKAAWAEITEEPLDQSKPQRWQEQSSIRRSLATEEDLKFL